MGIDIISINQIDDKEKQSLYFNKIYLILNDLRYEYPNFYDWFYSKVIPEVITGYRDINIALWNEYPAGVLITKNDCEKKICTLRVNDQFKKCGIGKKLFEKAFEILECDKPLVTIPENRIFAFNRILKYYSFSLEKVYMDYYRKGATEFVYNGLLNENTSDYSKLTKVV